MNILIFLYAIAVVESNSNDRAVGKRGEISRYQIRPHIWKSYSESTDYANHAKSKQVALKHLEFIRKRLPKPNDVKAAAAVWNYGITNFRAVQLNVELCPPRVQDYANRVYNTYRSAGGSN